MPVNLTVTALAAALRIGETTEETSEVTRLLAYATQAVTKYAPDAPDTVQNEAVIRLAGYIYDMPNTSARTGFANALNNSGAADMLFPYRVHRAGRCE